LWLKKTVSVLLRQCYRGQANYTGQVIWDKHTGLTIASHTGSGKAALEQIDLLEQYGVSPKAFIWVHAQTGEPSSQVVAAKKGAWISIDNVVPEASGIEENVKQILNLKKQGAAPHCFDFTWRGMV
jgi:predicted metal-dependent phosphotriesterase family hydrolase